jgi:hypothetical protein
MSIRMRAGIKTIALLASAALAASALVVPSAAAAEKSYKGMMYATYGGEATIYGYTGSSSSLTVPAKLGGNPVVEIQIQNDVVKKINIKKATSLRGLSLYGTKITTLDTSKNTKLTWMDVRSTKLSKLSLKKNTKLTKLYAAGDVIAKSSLNANKLTQLELEGKSTKFSISKYPNLKVLSLDGTNVTSVDLSKGKKLEQVTLRWNNRLAKLKVASPKLKYLGVSDNAKLSVVSVGKSPKLQELYLDSKAIKTVFLSGATDLRRLVIESASISNLNVAPAQKLTLVAVSNCNKLSRLNLSTLPKLAYVYVQDSAVTELKLGDNRLQELSLRYAMKLKKVTLGKQPLLTEVTLPYVSGFGLAIDRTLQPKLKTVWIYPAGAANEDADLVKVTLDSSFQGTVYNQF